MSFYSHQNNKNTAFKTFLLDDVKSVSVYSFVSAASVDKDANGHAADPGINDSIGLLTDLILIFVNLENFLIHKYTMITMI